MKQKLIIIAGPTASGKTGLSVALAKKINGAIISADSMQVYKHMDIGTAKITPQEMDGVPHYLIDELMPDEPFNIHIFQQRAKAAIREISEMGMVPILVGGTGFYVQSVVYDIAFEDDLSDDGYRDSLQALALEQGQQPLHDMLDAIDPKSAEAIHPNNVKRVIRALEFHHQTGKRMSEHNEIERQRSTPYDLHFYVLNMDRNLLYNRIDQRVDKMILDGLVEEVIKLRSLGYGRDLVSMQGLGYKEILDYLDGSCTLEEAIYILKRDTRHFAKRQLTWFRRERDVKWLNLEDYGFDMEIILKKITKDIEVNSNL